MVNPGYRLICHTTYAFGLEVGVKLAEKGDDSRRRRVFAHHEAAVSEALVRMEHAVLDVGRQQGVEPSAGVEHQGMVCEPVAVVVHIVPEEKERAVFRLRHEPVPLAFPLRRISYYVKHNGVLTYVEICFQASKVKHFLIDNGLLGGKMSLFICINRKL